MAHLFSHFPLLLSMVAIALLSGCAVPEASTAKLDTALLFSFHHAAAIKRDTDNVQWWDRFEDAELTALVKKGLASNHDIRIAAARIRAAHAGYDAYTSRFWPSLDFQTSASTTHSTLPAPYKPGMPDLKAYQGGIGLSWEIDLSGSVHAAAEAAREDALSGEYAAEGVRLLIVSEIARQYFILRGVQQRLRLLSSLANNRHEHARLISRRVHEGQSSLLDLHFAEAEAHSLDAQMPALQTLIDVAQTHIAFLIGESPSVVPVSTDPEYNWPASPDIGMGQPIDLLRRRPDLMAAEARYDAESLRSVEAASQTWPKLFVNALFGFEDLRVNRASLAPVAFSNIAAAFAVPIFNAGRIQSGIDLQNAREKEALLSWQKSVLTAVKEVEDTLSMRSNEMKRGVYLKASDSNHFQALLRAESLYREGQIERSMLLDAQRAVVASAIDIADHETQRLLADVQLYKALGGGWNASEFQSKEQTKELR